MVCPVWHVSAVYGDIEKAFSDGSIRIFVFPVDRIDAVCVWDWFFGAGRSRSEHAWRVDRGSGGERVQAIDLLACDPAIEQYFLQQEQLRKLLKGVDDVSRVGFLVPVEQHGTDPKALCSVQVFDTVVDQRALAWAAL